MCKLAARNIRHQRNTVSARTARETFVEERQLNGCEHLSAPPSSIACGHTNSFV